MDSEDFFDEDRSARMLGLVLLAVIVVGSLGAGFCLGLWIGV